MTHQEDGMDLDDGTSPGVQCGAVHDIAGRCTRDMAHSGAHVARSSTPGRGSGGWLNTRPGEPDTTYVEARQSDEKLRGVIGGTLAKLGYKRYPTPATEEAGAALNSAYRERNAVVAALIRVGGYPAEVVMAPDTEGWWIVYAETPEGQVSWHIGPDDMDLFRDWPVAFGSRPSPWDGHSTEEKYRRVARLAATPDNAGRSPIDVDVLATALCDDDDHLYYEDERHDRSSCGHRAQAARLVARLSESTGSEEGGPTRVE